MTHPGEQFYPAGVRWNDPIARGTLPDLLSKAATDYADAAGDRIPRPPDQLCASWKRLVEVAASAFLRAGYGKDTSVALFLGNTPDHPVNFFGALKAGARIVHLSPLDGEIALSHKLSDSGARVLVTSNLSALLPTALKFLEKGLLDRLIVCEDDHWGKIGTPQTPLPDNPAIITHRQFIDGATRPAQWPAIGVEDIALLQYTGGTTGLPKGAMLTHGNLTAAVSIYDVWGKAARAERGDPVERVICVLPLFHIFALTVVMLSCIRRGHLISLHQRFDVEAVMRDIEVKRATYFPGVPTMWIAIAALARSRQARFLVAAKRRLGRRAAADGGRQGLRAQGRHEAPQRLGHDRNLSGRHRASRQRDRTSPARSEWRCPASRWMWCRWRIPRRFCRPARSARSASRARTSPRAIGTSRRKPRRPLSATASSPATSAMSTTTAISSWSTARRT